jgi:hypothetical protein
MAITNTAGEGGNTTKGAKGDRGGPKIYIVVRRYICSPKIFRTCEDCPK